LFPVLQEALSDVHRHSESGDAELSLAATDSNVTLWGRAGMRERVNQLGGTLRIESGTKATTLTVVIPVAGGRGASGRKGPQLVAE
jgi:signal transduction histidine kinase